MCGGRATERQESDGEKAVGKEGGGVYCLNTKCEGKGGEELGLHSVSPPNFEE